jgi:ubiquinone/menaquinone biosynthesis C-methylase UbiE
MRLVSGDKPGLREHFDNVGRQLVRGLKNVEMIEPGARFLDIGCGCGRIARHLLDSPIASYAGFDPHEGMIEWAQAQIGARDGRFDFQHVDVQYAEFESNPGGGSAAEFVFPYDEKAFTSVLASSVFTHIDFAATSNYLNEVGRVLAPGGRALATFFSGEETGSIETSEWNFVIRDDDVRRAVQGAGLKELQLVRPVQPQSQHSWLLVVKPDA